VKASADQLITDLGDGSVTPANINTDSPSGYQNSLISLAQKLNDMLQDAGLGQNHQRVIRKA
jgi:hypothetical protein